MRRSPSVALATGATGMIGKAIASRNASCPNYEVILFESAIKASIGKLDLPDA